MSVLHSLRRFTQPFLLAITFSSIAMASQAKVITEEISYSIDDVSYTGFLAYDDDKGRQPGILVVHEWWGHNDYARQRTKQLAEEGYTAFALDMYGDGKLATHPKDANAFMTEVMKNLDIAEKRFDKAYDILQSSKYTEKENISALGYCFGGAVVLHMARAGKDLDSVISYHGSLGSAIGEKPSNIKAKVRVFTGQQDPMIPVQQVADFTSEMFTAGADFNVQVYPGVQHSFTNKGATKVGEKFELPLAYDAYADKDSWQQSMEFLDELYED